jgi:queuine tRNA-ribosyltransferase
MPNENNNRTLGDYEIHLAWEGFASIRQISSGEIMHSRTAPMEEAQALYVEQSNLTKRLRLQTSVDAPQSAPLMIWDVGLGAAANAMAAILCYEHEAAKAPVRALKIISFENDLDSLRLAFRSRDHFPYLEHSGPKGILEEGAWQSREYPGLSWLLVPGNFAETMSTAPGPPDLIFYDMFSTKTSRDLWTLDVFRKLFEVCSGHSAELFTYTCSTANRARLLAAGFYVARGRNAGEKSETTIAITPGAMRAERHDQRPELLGLGWLEKWNRSRAKFPEEIPHEQQDSFEQLIRDHPQWN